MEFSRLKDMKIISAIVLVSILISLSALFTLLISNYGQKCVFDKNWPEIDIDHLDSVHSEDLSVLATFYGALVIKSSQESYYLPLKLNGVGFHHSLQSRLHLTTGCSEVILMLTKPYQDDNIWSLESIQVTPVDSIYIDNDGKLSPLSRKTVDLCEIGNIRLEFRSNETYSCLKMQDFDCKMKDGRYYKLKIQALKMELFGDPEDVKRGIYTKKSHEC